MPTWVNNVMTVKGTPEKIQAFQNRFMNVDEDGAMTLDFDSIIPTPETLMDEKHDTRLRDLAIQAYLTMLRADCDYFETAFGLSPTCERKLSRDEYWALVGEAIETFDKSGNSPINKPDFRVMRESALSDFAKQVDKNFKNSGDDFVQKKRDAIALGKAAFESIRLHGFFNLRSWRISKWGTDRKPYGLTIEPTDDATLKMYFQTAYNTPIPLFGHLSEIISADESLRGLSFEVTYASSENEGFDAGKYTFDENGFVLERYEDEEVEALKAYELSWAYYEG